MSLNSKSPCGELRHAFRRFPQLLRDYFLPLLFFEPPDFAAGRDGLAVCFAANRTGGFAAAGAAPFPGLPACPASGGFVIAAWGLLVLLLVFSFLFGPSFIPESLRSILSRSSRGFP